MLSLTERIRGNFLATTRRYKSYIAETGVCYQYFYEQKRRVRRPGGVGAGVDFVFVVRPDQHPPFDLRIFLQADALDAWRRRHGRELDSNEQYALAKMRLFRAFDVLEDVGRERLSLTVNEENLEALLTPLGVA